MGARSRGEVARSARPRGREQRPADEEPAGPRRDGPGQDLGARPHGEPGRDRALQRLRHAPGVADLRAEQSAPGHHAGGAAVPEQSRGAVDALRPVDQRPADPAGHGRARAHQRRAVGRRAHRPAAVGHDLVQPQAWLLTRRGRRRRSSRRRRLRCRPRSRRRSRARRRRSRSRCRASASFC